RGLSALANHAQPALRPGHVGLPGVGEALLQARATPVAGALDDAIRREEKRRPGAREVVWDLAHLSVRGGPDDRGVGGVTCVVAGNARPHASVAGHVQVDRTPARQILELLVAENAVIDPEALREGLPSLRGEPDYLDSLPQGEQVGERAGGPARGARE